MSSEIKNPEIKSFPPAAKSEGPAKPSPAKPGPGKPKKPGPKAEKSPARLHPLHSFAGTVGAFGANPGGVYDRFTLIAGGTEYTVKFPPHFGRALHEAAQPGQAVAVLGHFRPAPKGGEHLHLVRIGGAGGVLRPQPAGPPATAHNAHGTVAELLLDPKGRPHGLRLADEAATELRFPPHLGPQVAERASVGSELQASGTRRADGPGEVRAPGTQPPLQVEILTVGGESFLIG